MSPKSQGQKRSTASAPAPVGKRAKTTATEKPSKKQKKDPSSSDDEDLQRALAAELELSDDEPDLQEEEEEEEEVADSDSEGGSDNPGEVSSDDGADDVAPASAKIPAKKKAKGGKNPVGAPGVCASCLNDPVKDRGSEIAFEESSFCLFSECRQVGRSRQVWSVASFDHMFFLTGPQAPIIRNGGGRRARCINMFAEPRLTARIDSITAGVAGLFCVLIFGRS
jgi:hypothetical protein